MEAKVNARKLKADAPEAPAEALGDAAPREPGLLRGRFDARFFAPLPDDELAGWGG